MAADTSWTLDPGPILLIAGAVGLYVPRWLRVRRHDGARAAGAWRLAAFAGAIAALVAALLSPIDRLGEQSFAIHMVQHVLLLDIVPVLLMCSLTKTILRPATRRMQGLERAAGPFGHPVFAVAAYVVLMWVWHIPALYDAALEHATVHVLEHVVFMSIGLLYWWHLLSPVESRIGQGVMAPVVYMLSTKLAVGVLGIALTFAPESIYAFYEQREPIWGLTAGDDQALAGAVMALEQSVIMGIALAWLFVRALERSEREEQRAERYGEHGA